MQVKLKYVYRTHYLTRYTKVYEMWQAYVTYMQTLTPQQRAEVEADPEISMKLTELRRQIDHWADRAARLERAIARLEVWVADVTAYIQTKSHYNPGVELEKWKREANDYRKQELNAKFAKADAEATRLLQACKAAHTAGYSGRRVHVPEEWQPPMGTRLSPERKSVRAQLGQDGTPLRQREEEADAWMWEQAEFDGKDMK